ncbi:hypothetical protein QBC33DRAFT_582673, partial [Phialemonium atrogriseum]
MIISAENSAMERYCSPLNCEAESNSDDDESDCDSEDGEEDEDDEDDEDDKKPTRGSKRKTEALRARDRPPKQSNAGAAQPRRYLLKLNCRETGEGMIQSTAEKGTIKFNAENLASFNGKTNLPCVGQGVPFTARKISDVPCQPRNSWADYSERAYELAWVRRWN